MTKEQSEVIKDIKIYIHDIISESVDEVGYKRYEISEEEQEFFNNIERLLNMLKEQDKEIEKKEKMIDLLVNKLNQNCKVFENSEIKEIVEIYEKIKSTSNLRGIEVRKECIKQYFERKATNDA